MKLLIVALLCICSAVGDLDTEWWKHTIIYELIVNSFKDSNGDGIGDIKGIISKLDHFVDLGIDTLYLTPCFESPMKDMGYEISNYYKFYHKYGTMEDFEELIKEMNARGMKLIFDLVINHSSDTHEWFQKSIEKIEPYTNYYIWADAVGFYNDTTTPKPPNDWSSLFDGSAWEWNSKRKQFYYHTFTKEQPDLNLRNEIVKTELKNIIKFWMDKGVAGFGLNAPIFYTKPVDLQEEMSTKKQHFENIKFIRDMRLFLDEYNKKHGGIERIFCAEARVNKLKLYDYYDHEDHHVTHFPFHYMDGLTGDLTATYFYNHFKDWFEQFPAEHYVSVWVTEDHDVARIGNRMSPEFADILTMMTMTLPGSVCLYYGQEIAMKDGYITSEQIRDVFREGRRDPARMIMQWNHLLNAGFSTNMTTYLPVSSEYPERNVMMQKRQQNSHYNVVKTLSNLRKTDTLKYGDVEFALGYPETFIFWRTLGGHETYVFVANMNHSPAYVNLKYLLWNTPETFVVAVASVNSEYKKGDRIQNNFLYQIPLNPLSCVVLTFTSEE